MNRHVEKHDGFALIMVLFLLAAATVLGLGYVTSSTLKLAGSQNLLHAAQAKYLAESGLEHALCLLRIDAESVLASSGSPVGPFYLDESNNPYYFYAVADQDAPGIYYLTGQATVGGITRRCSYTVFRGGGAQKFVSHGMVIGDGVAVLPSSLMVEGDIHSNGDILLNYARIAGDVSSCGVVYDPLSLISGEITTDVTQASLPDLSVEYYRSYNVGGQVCAAAETTDPVLEAQSPYNNGGAIRPDNVGGVLYMKPQADQQVVVGSDVNFEGTLIADTDLVFDGTNITLASVTGFPAVITSGKALISPNAEVTIKGLVMAAGGILAKDGVSDGSRTTIEGAVVADRLGYHPALTGEHLLRYVEDNCRLYDFSVGPEQDAARVELRILEYY